MRNPCALAILASTWIWLSSAAVVAEGLTPREEFFENEVRPLLIAKCQECHDASLQESDLRLDDRSLVLQGGISGPAAIARNVDDSLIVQAVLGQNGMQRMPPDGPLEPAEIAVLKKWVRIGLPWTSSEQPAAPSLGDQEAIGKAAKTHWAFQPIAAVTPPVPATPADDDSDDAGLAGPLAHPIDAFIAEKLADNDLRPNAPASRRVLARRLYLDLIGLPPTAKQLDALESDPRDDDQVIGELVSRLLASEDHGARWARYWMDLARYADTRDWQAQAELRYPYAYTYRDYLIESINRDKPYDQFVREQIAADFYTDDDSAPELAALGLLTVGPRFRNNRLEQAADTIDVVCRGLMGITVSCARCHDHKYDPVPIEDFYSLYGVFTSTEIPDTLPVIPGAEPDDAVRADFDAQLAAAEQELLDYKQGLRADAIKDLKAKLPTYFRGFTLMSIANKSDIRGTISKLKVKETAMTPLNRILAASIKDTKLADDPVLGPWQQGLSLSEAAYAKRAAKLTSQWLADESIHPWVRQQIKADAPGTRAALVDTYATVFERAIKQLDAPEPSDDAIASIRDRLIGAGGWFDLDIEQVAGASRLLGKGRKELGDRQKAITEVEATHPGAPARAMTVVDIAKPITPFVFLRGEPKRRGDRVPRQFLSLIEGPDRRPFRDGSGRRELAEAIVDPGNPLTARVFVNRVWAKYFGAGLAQSLDDFGLRSSPPSHPELLDYLAGQFIANGWSMKWLHRTITTSRTYAQSAEIRDDGLAADPENRLLWRQNRRRLDFEAMRDSMLSVAGVLDPTVGGRSVKLSETPYSTRRSVYAYIDRIELDPMLRTFDFASPTASAASRPETTVPQQALFSMNHPLVADLARRIDQQTRGDDSVADQVRRIYRRVHGRSPSAQESEVAVEFIRQSSDAPNVAETTWRYGYGPLQVGGPDRGLRPFTPLAHWTGSGYQASDQFPDPEQRFLKVTSVGGHPGEDADHSLIRRWIAPSDGLVRINGTLKHTRENSDGVIGTIRVGQKAETFAVAAGNVKTPLRPVAVVAGQPIDFVVSPGPTSRADAFTWVVTISGVGGSLEGQSWNSRSDFQAPPPPPLGPTAQVAQALLLTNEFLYLD